MSGGLTKKETKVIDYLFKACELYNKLPQQHPCDMDEWNFGVHICQGLLMQRVVRRVYPNYWRNDDK